VLVGYARTSTVEQETGLAAQERDLRVAGCQKVFAERVSSAARRDKLQAACQATWKMRPGATGKVRPPS
jgi:DNA invertase Pin-like site-specific DNA recombinase